MGLFIREKPPLSQTSNISVLSPAIDDRENDRVWGLPLTAWVQIVTVTVLMCALFRFNLARLWGKTNPIDGQDSNWQHAIFVPLIGIYYLYIHRDELLRAAALPKVREKSIRVLALIGVALMAAAGAKFMQIGETGTPLMLVGVLAVGLILSAVLPTSTTFGSVLLIEGLLVFAYGIFPGQNDYIKDLGMVVTIFGTATLLAGWPVMKIAWFPIAFLVVALPWPELVYSKLAWPLQQLAASVAVGTLRVFGVTAQNFGTKIQMFDKNGMPRILNVAEACAGLKSVMTFLMVGATVGFLSQRRLWEKLVITLSAIPIAIFCNVVRVSGQGLLDRYVSHEWSEGFAHQFAGLVMVIPGFFLILLVGWLLDQLFIEEVDRDQLATAGAAGAGARAVAAPSRSKRMIVEVPRKKLASAPATSLATAEGPATSEPIEVATPGEPVSAPLPLPPVSASPAARSTPPAPPAAAAAAAKAAPAVPPAPAPAPAAPRSSTLKPSTTARPATTPSPAAPGASTLKPSSKPAAAPRTLTPPPAGLKPSTLKQPASPAKPQAPAAAAQPAQMQSQASRPKPPTTPGVPAAPRQPAPPARKPPLSQTNVQPPAPKSE